MLRKKINTHAMYAKCLNLQDAETNELLHFLTVGRVNFSLPKKSSWLTKVNPT